MADKTTGTTPGGMPPGTPGDGPVKKTAGALDIRNVIGALLSIYGVILVLMGLFGDPETDKTGGSNANLWSGLAMLVVGLGFIAWSRLKPVVVAEEPADQS